MRRILNPKFVKKANLWCVTIFNGEKQEVKWFESSTEAWNFVKEETKK